MNTLTTAEAAEAAGVTAQAIRMAVRRKRIEGIKRGRDWHFEPAEVERYKQQAKAGNPNWINKKES